MVKFTVKLFNSGNFERNGCIIPEDVLKKAVDEYIAKSKFGNSSIGKIKHIERDNNILNIEIDEN